MPESSLDWYFRVLLLCGSIRGELKSADVWPRFQAVQGENKDRIWAGLSKVRIHIVDPRPYHNSYNNLLRKALRCDDPATFIRRQVAEKDPRAIILSRELQIVTAQRILDDSIAARLHNLSMAVSDFEMFLGHEEVLTGHRLSFGNIGLELKPIDRPREEVISLSDFGSKAKPIVRKVSEWSAKSAATFHEALDTYFEAEGFSYFPNDFVRRRMKDRVLDTHVFDEGDKKQLELLENARGNILQYLETFRDGVATAKPYSELNSNDSFLVQAADIAAGIASKIVERRNLVAVVSAFEYVTYNGRRVAISDMEEELRRMGQ